MAQLRDFSTLDISWNLTPEHAVTMYLEWGNNDWHSEYPPVRSKSDESYYFVVDTWDEFVDRIEKGGFLLCHWDGTRETEEKIKELTKATIRCIPIDTHVMMEEGKCIYSGKPSKQRVIFARSY